MTIIKAHCNNCCGERNHELLRSENTSWEEDIEGHYYINGSDTYEMIKCCGCENVALRHKSWFSEEKDNYGEPITNVSYYPPATFRKEPNWLHHLYWSFPSQNNYVLDLIKEIYVAMRNDSCRLAVMGIRALLEQVMIDKIGDQKSFIKNLNLFESEGYISKSQRVVLDSVLEAGHATMHRAFKPSQSDLLSLLDITENIIESIYINERKVNGLKDKIPARK